MSGSVDSGSLRPSMKNTICSSFPPQTRKLSAAANTVHSSGAGRWAGKRIRSHIKTNKQKENNCSQTLSEPLVSALLRKSNAGCCKAYEELLYRKRFHTAKTERSNRNQPISILYHGGGGSHLCNW